MVQSDDDIPRQDSHRGDDIGGTATAETLLGLLDSMRTQPRLRFHSEVFLEVDHLVERLVIRRYGGKEIEVDMVVRLRLARFGRRNLPFYRIFVADARAPRDGKHIEIVGHYNPIPTKDGNKHIGLNIDRIKYWMSVGAQPSNTVGRLLGQAGVIPMPPRPDGQKRGPKKEEKKKK